MYNDAKTMFAAIETRFGGNKATKKTQKTLLKQQYENFSASSIESLDSIFNRLQKIVSRLAILGVVITQEDLNSNFLGSLPPEWNTHVVVWMNKAEIEKMSIDDLYNNFKIVEQSVKKSVGASSGAQTLAFMTAPSTNSTNDVNTAKPAYEVSTVSPNVNTASPQVSTASFSDNAVYAFLWQLSLLSMRAKRVFQLSQDGDIFRGSVDTGANKEQKRSDMAEEQVQTNMALMAFSDSEEEQLVTYRKNEVLFSEEVAVLKREVACKDYEISVLKTEFEKVKQEKEGIEFKIEKFDNASKSLDKLLGSQITDRNPEFKSYGSKDSKLESNNVYDTKSDDSKENFDDSLVKEQVSEDASSFVESSLNVDKETVFLVDKKIKFVKPKNHEKLVKKSVRLIANTIKGKGWTVNTAHPKSIIFSAKSMSRFSKSAQSTVKRPYQSKTVLTNKKFTQTNNTAKAKAVNTARPKAVNTARPHSVVVNAVRVNHENVVKALTFWVWRPTKLDSASITLKKHNYIDARGRSNTWCDYAGATQDRKSTTRGCQFLGNRLISWQCKKHTVVATSTTEAEYVATASCCGQIFLQKVLMLEGLVDEVVHKENLGDRMEREDATTASLVYRSRAGKWRLNPLMDKYSLGASEDAIPHSGWVGGGMYFESIRQDAEGFLIDETHGGKALKIEPELPVEKEEIKLLLIKKCKNSRKLSLQSELLEEETLQGKTADDSDSIRHIKAVNMPHPVAQKTAKPNKVKSEQLYLASANEIDEKKLELKIFPQHLEYAYLHGDKSFPIIILSKLSEKEKLLLLQVVEKRFFQILIALEDQEKTTFTCPYGTFAYRRMPFRLCNAPATFQRCMTVIFYDMVKDFMEVFMDDFSVFGNSFDCCLANLDRILARCEETNLVLN
ncbi:putative ribonuclease H-like domain-containing protein [Tanacetum coccineum]